MYSVGTSCSHIRQHNTKPSLHVPTPAFANSDSGAMTTKYDDGNLFNKILKGEIPCNKIFETEHALAILDAFPVAPGHALLLPKAKCVSVLDMPAEVASAFLGELPRLARLVQAATGAPACNILQNSGKDAGQVVFHCHFHVIPRFPDDGALSLKAGRKDMLPAAEAAAMLAKMVEPKRPYEASLGAIDQLMEAIGKGNLTPPPPPPPSKQAPKAAAAPAPATASVKDTPPATDAKPGKDKKEKAKEASAPGGGGGDKGADKEEKKAKKEAAKAKAEAKAPPAAAAADRALDVSWADIRVGKILDAKPHPDSDKLYVETIDLGEAEPRQILSGLAQHMPLEAVKGAMVVCICNLKARKIGGLESAGMVLCASDAGKTSLCFVTPPAGAAAGERIMFDGFPGEPEAVKKMDKKKGWEAIQPELNTNADGVCCYRDKPFSLGSGVCTATVTGGIIS